jgi:hypothetical protein
MQELLHDGRQWVNVDRVTSSSWVLASVAQRRPGPPPAIPTHIPAGSSNGVGSGVPAGYPCKVLLMQHQLAGRHLPIF